MADIPATVPTDAYELLHWNMVLAHDTFKLGYDKIVEVLADPPMKDLPNFLGYCQAWAKSIEEHHNSEEAVVFPFLNEKMDFAGEVAQHKAVHAVLDELAASLAASEADPAHFDAAALRALMVRFREPLYTHLDDEVEHIRASELRAAGFSEDALRGLVARLEAYARAHGDPFLQVPFMRSHTPAAYKECWPPMPWVLRKVVVPYVLALRHAGYWKYAPYAMS
ncbi:hypothetical protein PsYK624_013220 [Phanerochaete sordida]|uniref:Hemerythrin-like domain-containing protein n=1 Tax=Phanerochaete sordida TaxID=48140 RepID=A0A9P3FZN5_9APHY|nr:hypothetical protein PsYK624_013220 [Phanerochaete sordida]